MPIISVPVPSFYQPAAPPAPIPRLTAETDLVDLSTVTQLVFHEEVDPQHPKRPTRPSFVDAPMNPRSKKCAVSSSPERRARSPADYDTDLPSIADSTTSDDEDEDEDEDDSEMSDVDEALKIPKPAGEAGRPGRGGYSLEQVLNWPPTRLKQFKKTIAKSINEHLNPTCSFSGQSLASIRIVREEALQRFPELSDYEHEWPATDAVKLRLKYTSARARKAAQQTTTIDTTPREKRSRKSRKNTW